MTHLLLNRSLLFRDLNDLGISTKCLNTIKTIYSQVECAIKLKGSMTNGQLRTSSSGNSDLPVYRAIR